MIFFLAPSFGLHYMREFLAGPGSALAPRMEVLSHEEACAREARPGVYIFAGVQQLTAVQRAPVAELWLRLSRLGPEVRLLNDPREVLTRYELLRELHSAGVNTFRARRLHESGPPLRFPVFIRHEVGHDGSLTRLLRNQRELDVATDTLEGLDDAGNLLVVEFCDTSDGDGLFRKYGAFMVGDRVIPRSLMFSRRWMLQEQDLLDADKRREEREFLETNPHEDWIREVFRLAGVSYGRLDYSLLDGRPQAWEINTNPWPAIAGHQPADPVNEEMVARRLVAAFRDLDRRRAPDPASRAPLRPV